MLVHDTIFISYLYQGLVLHCSLHVNIHVTQLIGGRHFFLVNFSFLGSLRSSLKKKKYRKLKNLDNLIVLNSLWSV